MRRASSSNHAFRIQVLLSFAQLNAMTNYGPFYCHRLTIPFSKRASKIHPTRCEILKVKLTTPSRHPFWMQPRFHFPRYLLYFAKVYFDLAALPSELRNELASTVQTRFEMRRVLPVNVSMDRVSDYQLATKLGRTTPFRISPGQAGKTHLTCASYTSPSAKPIRRTAKATTHATRHCSTNTASAQRGPSSFFTAPMAATQGGYSSVNTRNT